MFLYFADRMDEHHSIEAAQRGGWLQRQTGLGRGCFPATDGHAGSKLVDDGIGKFEVFDVFAA